MLDHKPFLLTPRDFETDRGETARLAALNDLRVLDTLPEEAYDHIVRLVANICGTPVGLVSFVDADRQWFKSRYGLAACETSRESSFCARAIEEPSEIFVVSDALADPRFRENPLVVGEPHIRFYAGMPLVTKSGHAIGSVCVIDRVPRILGEKQLEALRLASRIVMELLEQAQQRTTAIDDVALFSRLANDVSELVMLVRVPSDVAARATVAFVNTSFARYFAHEISDATERANELFATLLERSQFGTLRRKLSGADEFVSVIDFAAEGLSNFLDATFSPLQTGEAERTWLVVLRDMRPGATDPSAPHQSELATANATLRRELELRTQREEQMRAIDGLTELPNRRSFEGRLQRALGRTLGASSSVHGAVLIVDVDHFKQINDTYGQAAGDELLRRLAMRLQTCARAEDVVARSGGNAFAMLIAAASIAETERIAVRVLAEMAAPCGIAGSRIVPSASIGICMIDASYSSADAVLLDADTAMFHAKDRGRKRFEFFRPELRERSIAQAALDRTLSSAFDQRRFRLVYQPIMALGNGVPHLDAFESLLRLEDAAGKPINPATMIERAEKTGLIVPLGEWIVETACMQLVKWSTSGPTPCVSINVSPKQLASGTFVSTVKRCMGYSGVDPRKIAFELTESALMEDPDGALDALDQLRGLRSKVYLDDFGTGYSSLNYLRRFTIDRLKIDRAFVSGSQDDLEDPVIVETIVSLAHRLGIEVVAEGIETVQQLRALVEMGAEAGQGYLFSPGVPGSRAAELIADERPLVASVTADADR